MWGVGGAGVQFVQYGQVLEDEQLGSGEAVLGCQEGNGEIAAGQQRAELDAQWLNQKQK